MTTVNTTAPAAAPVLGKAPTWEAFSQIEKRLFETRFTAYIDAITGITEEYRAVLDGYVERGTMTQAKANLYDSVDRVAMAAISSLIIAGVARQDACKMESVTDQALDVLDGALEGNLEEMLEMIR
jgi:hypothetical protein